MPPPRSSHVQLPPVPEAPGGLEESDVSLGDSLRNSVRSISHLPDLVKRQTNVSVTSDAGSVSAVGSDFSARSSVRQPARESLSQTKRKESQSVRESLSQTKREEDRSLLTARQSSYLQRTPIAGKSRKQSDAFLEFLAYLQEDVIRVEVVAEILEESSKSSTLVNQHEQVFGWHSLLFAANNGNAHLMQILLDATANVDAVDNLGNTALQVASRSDHLQAVEHLLARQADVNAKNRQGWTALLWAAMAGHHKVVPRLLDAAAEINIADDQGRTACMWASRHRHLILLQALLVHGPDLRIRDNDGLTALDHAIECQELRNALQKVDAVNRGLLDAARQNQPDAVIRALTAGASANASDEDGSALGWAAAHGSVEMVRVLMRHGGNPEFLGASSVITRQREADVAAALQDALGVSDRLVNAARDQRWQDVSKALAAGAYIEARDRTTLQTALIFAGRYGASNTVLELASARANLERRDVHGWTAVHSAALYGWADTVSTLYYLGADLFTQTYEGDFAQHLSARSDQWSIVQVLCAARADVNAQNAVGHTPLQEAVIAGSLAAISILVANEADPSVRDGSERNLLALAVMQGNGRVVEALLNPHSPQEHAGKGKTDPLDPSKPVANIEVQQASNIEETTSVTPSTSAPPKKRKTRKIAAHSKASTDAVISQLSDARPNHSKAGKDSDEEEHSKPRKTVRALEHEEKLKPRKTIAADHSKISAADHSKSSAADHSMKHHKTKKKKAESADLQTLEELVPPTSADYLLARARIMRDMLPKDMQSPLSRGPALSAPDADGRTVLTLAVRFRHDALVNMLLSLKANVDATDVHGITALMLAAKWGDPEVIEKLLRAGARVQVEDKDGKTTFEYACNARVRRQLEEHTMRLAVNQRVNSQASSMPSLTARKSVDERKSIDGAKRGSRASSTTFLPFKPVPTYRLRLERLPVRLPMDMVEGQILHALKRRGAPVPLRVDVVVDPITQRPRGYAYVEYSDAWIAEAVALDAHKDPHGLFQSFGTGVCVVLEGAHEGARGPSRGTSRASSRGPSRGPSRGLQL